MQPELAAVFLAIGVPSVERLGTKVSSEGWSNASNVQRLSSEMCKKGLVKTQKEEAVAVSQSILPLHPPLHVWSPPPHAPLNFTSLRPLQHLQRLQHCLTRTCNTPVRSFPGANPNPGRPTPHFVVWSPTIAKVCRWEAGKTEWIQ